MLKKIHEWRTNRKIEADIKKLVEDIEHYIKERDKYWIDEPPRLTQSQAERLKEIRTKSGCKNCGCDLIEYEPKTVSIDKNNHPTFRCKCGHEWVDVTVNHSYIDV